MIDYQALKSFGVFPLNIEEKPLSLGSQGRFPTTSLAYVDLSKPQTEQELFIGSPFDTGVIRKINLQDDQDFLEILKIFISTWQHF